MADSLQPNHVGLVVRNTHPHDIEKIVDLQKNHFHILHAMEIYGIQKS
jgi:hypothetical protein